MKHKNSLILIATLWSLLSIFWGDFSFSQQIPWELSGYVVNKGEQTEFLLAIKNVGQATAKEIKGVIIIGNTEIDIGTKSEILPFNSETFEYKMPNTNYTAIGRYLIPFKISYRGISNAAEDAIFFAQLENLPTRETAGITISAKPVVLSKSKSSTLTIENTDPWEKIISLVPIVTNAVSIKLENDKIILAGNSKTDIALTVLANNLLAKTNFYIIGRYEKDSEVFSSSVDIEIDPLTRTSLLEKVFSRTIMIYFTIFLVITAFLMDYTDKKIFAKVSKIRQ